MNKKLLVILMAVSVTIMAVIIGIIIYSLVNSDEKAYRVLKVENYEGSVKVERFEKIIKVFEGMKLMDKDTVTVDSHSFVEIVADSDKHIVADENTCFSIKSKGSKKNGNIEINLEYGSSLFEIENKLSKNSEFKVKTTNATASVRGTKFRVTYNPDKIETEVNVYEGIVAVASKISKRDVEAGQTVVINKNGEIILLMDVNDNDNNIDDNNNDGFIDEIITDIPEGAPVYVEETPFDLLEEHAGMYEPLWVKQLDDWEYSINNTENNILGTHEFKKDGVTISYILTENDSGLYRLPVLGEHYKIDSKVVYNADGDEILYDKFDYEYNGYNGITYAHVFTKQILEDFRMIIYIYDTDKGESLSKFAIDTFAELTTNKYFADTRLSNVVDGESETIEEPIIDDTFLNAVKGGITMNQLELLLRMGLNISNASDGYASQYMISELFYAGGAYFTPIETNFEGSIYNLSEINEFLTIITDEQITDDITYSYGNVVGNELHVRMRDVARGGSTGIVIDKKYDNGNGETVIEYTYHSTFGSDTRGGVDGTAVAYFKPNGDGEYVIDRVEKLTSEEWTTID